MRPFLVLLCGLLLCSPLSPARALDPSRRADEYAVRGWSMADGLPHNLIQAVAQDDRGLLWLGTWEGLKVFNGREFSPVPGGLPEGVDMLAVGALLAGADGAMLVGTTHVGVLRHQDGRWTRLGGDAGARLAVTTLAHGHDGDLWIGTRDALYRLDRAGVLHAVGDAGDLRGAIGFVVLPEPDGSVLVGNSRGLFRWSPAGIEPLGRDIGLPVDRSVRALARFDGALWIASDDGTWTYRDGRLERLLAGPSEALIVDRDGQVWTAPSRGGLVRHGPDGPQQLGPPHGLVGRNSRALFEDREGLLWVGTTNGLYRVADGAVSSITAAAGLGDAYVRSILQTADGTVWVGHAAGLERWRDGTMARVRLMPDGRPESSTLALAPADDGGVWIGTYAQGLFHAVPAAGGATLRTRPVGGLPRGQIRALHQQADGALWVGGTFGLLRLHEDRMERFGTDDGLPGDFVQGLMAEPDGTLWIGTSDGMARRSPDGRLRAWRAGEDFPAHTAFDFLRDADGSLWVASDRGLLRLRGEGFARYGVREGLPREVVFRVLDDGRGSLWLSSNDGLFRIARQAFDRHDETGARLAVEVFDRDDGMPGSQANGGSHPAGWRTADGRLWFPTVRGVAIVDPALAERQRERPVSVIVQSVQVDGIERGAAAVHAVEAGERRLRIHYAGMNLRGAEKLRYRYRLAGFDEDWVDAGTAMEAVYTNLPPGRLRFEVQAMRMPADWTGARARIASTAVALDVPLPWWRRPGWLMLAIGAALLLAWGAYALGTLQLRRSRRRLQRRIEAATQELRGQHDALAAAAREREALLARLAHQAQHDPLTGLPNRRASDAFLAAAAERHRQTGEPVTVALLDLDHFKRINDAHGHAAGDEVLREVGAFAAAAIGDGAFVGRHGGEEFIACLPGLPPAAARARLEALRTRLADTPIPLGDAGVAHCTVSIGMAMLAPGDTPRTLLARADARLYQAKREGRNRLCG